MCNILVPAEREKNVDPARLPRDFRARIRRLKIQETTY